MSHKPNCRNLHDNDEVRYNFGGGGSRKKSGLGIIPTQKFTTIVLVSDDEELQEEIMDDDGGGEMDDFEIFNGDNIDVVVPEEGTPYQMEQDRLKVQELIEDKEFTDIFMKELVKPLLDPTYKYPKISIMVSDDDDSDLLLLKDQQNRRKPFSAPSDALDLFDRGFADGPNKGSAAEAFSAMVADLNLNIRQQNEILNFLSKHTRSLNLFVKGPTESSIAADTVNSSMSSYLEPDYRDTTIDCCPNGCMAYMGILHHNGRDKDCSREIRCLECKTPRFTHCGHTDCKEKSYDECNLYADNTDRSVLKYHGNRTPLETVFFRSSMSKLAQLFCLSQTKNNHRLLKYHEDRIKKDGKIFDICDGSEVILHQGIMAERFERYREEFLLLNPGVDIDECSLCLSFFYDGGVNHKRGADSMWPLVTSVVNCNPSNRTKLGIGSSLSLLHNMAGSKVEKFLLRLYAKELKAIENGVVFAIAGHTPEDKIKYVFLQARLVYMHADTKAVESITCSKGSASKICTVCNLNQGIYHPILKKVTYPGTRITAPQDHLIRFLGEREFEKIEPEHLVEDLEVKKAYKKDASVYKGAYKPQYLDKTPDQHQELYYKGDQSVYQLVQKKMGNVTLSDAVTNIPTNYKTKVATIQYPPLANTAAKKAAFVASKKWFNHLFPYSKMSRHMRFPYPDSRAQLVYEHVDNKTYLEDGRKGQEEHDKYEAKLKSEMETRGRERPKTKKDSSCNGRHGVCPLMDADLESFGFLNICFDFMHYGANVLKYFLAVMKGDRATSEIERKLSVAMCKDSSLMYSKRLADFQLQTREETMVDAVVNSLLISPLYKVDFCLKYPFQQSGFLKSHECLVMLMSYLPYALSFTDLHANYQEFYARYAYDMKCLLNPCLDVAELREQYVNNVYETRWCQEGLYPESECVYIFHEIIDIIHQIEKYGHIRSLMCFFGERAMGIIKSFVSKGGVHYLKTLYHRYVLKENSIAGQMTNNELFFTNHYPEPKYSDFVLKLLGKGKKVQWCEVDKDEFFLRLLLFIETQCIDMIHEKSPFFRLYKAYQRMVAKKRKGAVNGFTAWVTGLSNALSGVTGDADGNELTRSEDFVAGVALEESSFSYEDICNGYIYSCDLEAVKDSILKFDPLVYEKLITKGIVFNCRGHDYSLLQSVILNENKKLWKSGNDLSKCWHIRDQYASFFRCTIFKPSIVRPNGEPLPYRHRKRTSGAPRVGRKRSLHTTEDDDVDSSSDENEDEEGDNDSDSDSDSDASSPSENEEMNTHRSYYPVTEFGQLNSCFRTHMPNDKIVHGLAFASVTFRRAKENKKRRHYFIAKKDSSVNFDTIKRVPKFMCVNFIDSTSIGVSVLSAAEKAATAKKKRGKEKFKPMLKPTGVQSFIQYTDATRQSSGSYAKIDATMDEMFLIELHPERVSYRYDVIHPDNDGTKLWEQV